jgi:hypothetical protein
MFSISMQRDNLLCAQSYSADVKLDDKLTSDLLEES